MEDSRAKQVAGPRPPASSTLGAVGATPQPVADRKPSSPGRDAERRRRWQRAREVSPEQKVREEAFWGRYEALVRGRGVRPGLEVWYRRHCEAFIRSIRPQRLAEAGAAEVTRFLHRLWQGGRHEGWQVRQAMINTHVLRQGGLGVRSPLGL
jgi:hypothetical protein